MEAEIRQKDSRRLSYDHAHGKQLRRICVVSPIRPIDNKTLTILRFSRWSLREKGGDSTSRSIRKAIMDSYELPSYFHCLWNFCLMTVKKDLHLRYATFIRSITGAFSFSFSFFFFLSLSLLNLWFWYIKIHLSISLSVIIIYLRYY